MRTIPPLAPVIPSAHALNESITRQPAPPNHRSHIPMSAVP